MSDAFTPYETGLHVLLERLGESHPRYTEALTLQSRLLENITQARCYGDTETRRAERAQIIDILNQLAVESVRLSFNQLCEPTRESEELVRADASSSRAQQISSVHIDARSSVFVGGKARITQSAVGHGQVRLAAPTSGALGETVSGNTKLQQLADYIAKDLDLLKKYEDVLRSEDDQCRLARYHQEIEQLRELAVHYQQEYEDLRAQGVGEPPVVMQEVATQLQQMGAKLDALLAKQAAISYDLSYLRQTLLTHYAASERTIIATIMKQLNQAQLVIVRAVLDTLEAGSVTEAETYQVLDAVQEMLTVLQQHGVSLPGQQVVVEAVTAPTLDVKHKLKVTLPIIPLLLSYEGELELGSRANLKALWEQLIGKVRGKR